MIDLDEDHELINEKAVQIFEEFIIPDLIWDEDDI